MAKKKSPVKAKTVRVRTDAINIRCMPDFKRWVDQMAEADRCSLAELIDRALTAYASKIKFTTPAPRR